MVSHYKIRPSRRRINPGFKRSLGFFVLNLLAIIVRLCTSVHRRRLRSASAGIRKAVFIEPFGMGDVMAMQPVVKAYCDSGFNVFVFVKKEWHLLLVPHKRLVCADFRPSWAEKENKYRNLFTGLSSLRSMMRQECAGAVGIDVRGDIRSVILLYLAGCSKVMTLSRYYTANDCRILPGVAERREITMNVERWRVNSIFADGLRGNGAALVPPSLSHYLLKPKGSAALSAMFSSKDDKIGLIPLTTWVGKVWFPDQWSELIQRIKAASKIPVLLCGPGDYNSAMESVFGERIAVREVRDVGGWISAIAECSAIVTVNTGPMHIAAAMGKRIVVVDGPSRLPLWAPVCDNAIVVHHQDITHCAPCHQIGNTDGCMRQCMAAVTASEVFDALISLDAL